MLLRLFPRGECTEIAAFAGLEVHLARVKPVASGLEFAKHGTSRGAIAQTLHTLLLGAQFRVAEVLPPASTALADHSQSQCAQVRECVNSALEAIECHRLAAQTYLKRVVVVVFRTPHTAPWNPPLEGQFAAITVQAPAGSASAPNSLPVRRPPPLWQNGDSCSQISGARSCALLPHSSRHRRMTPSRSPMRSEDC